MRERASSATREIALVLSVVLLVGLGAVQAPPDAPVQAPDAQPVAAASPLPSPV
ncbi:MAG: hypothetical protein JWP11_3302, partial [Frankiales bacterium]|nr:hypothetical protein [Frankiales bacterium]